MNDMNTQKIIEIIGEYEESILADPKERITHKDVFGRNHLNVGDIKAEKYKDYAECCKEYLRFGQEVDAVVNKTYEVHDSLKICETPQVLLDAGFTQKPMLYTQRHLREALMEKSPHYPHRHGLTIAQVKNFPQWLENPVIMANSPSRSDALLMVLCAVDNDKLPLIASIKPNGLGNYELEQIETNMILTVFGKDRFDKYFENVLTSDRIIYFCKEKGQELERLSGRQLPGDYYSLIPNIIIRQPECLVNQNTVKSDFSTKSITGKTAKEKQPASGLRL